MHAAHGLHHRIDGGIIQDIPEIFGDLGIRQGDVLQTYHRSHGHIISGFDDIVDTSAYHTKAQQTDLHMENLRILSFRREGFFLGNTCFFTTNSISYTYSKSKYFCEKVHLL